MSGTITQRCGRSGTAARTALVYSEYIAAYIQGLYNIVRVLGGGCPVRQDTSEQKYASTGLPRALVSAWRRRGLTSWAESAGAADTASVEAIKASPVQGIQKPPQSGRKTVPGLSLGGA